MTPAGAAGTASAGFRSVPAPCASFTPAPADPDERVRCVRCDREKAAHIPAPRRQR